MPNIPNAIGGVTMEFADSVQKDVTQEMLDALEDTISSGAVAGETIAKLYVSSANDSHICPSRHKTGNAVDISRVNGKFIFTDYSTDSSTKSIVDGLQTKFESARKRRENFGPTIQKKNGNDYPVSGHKDHFHWSVAGDHSACTPPLWQRILEFVGLGARKEKPAKQDEICNN